MSKQTSNALGWSSEGLHPGTKDELNADWDKSLMLNYVKT